MSANTQHQRGGKKYCYCQHCEDERQAILLNDVPITLLPYVFKIFHYGIKGWTLWIRAPENGDVIEHIRLATENYKDRFTTDLGKDKVLYKNFIKIRVDIDYYEHQKWIQELKNKN